MTVSEPSPDSAEFFEARGFGTTIGFGSRPALVVIDMINAFTDPEMPLGSDLDPVVDELTPLLHSARQADIPVLFTTVGYDEGLADAGVWFLKQRALTTLMLGSPAVEVDSRLQPAPGEQVILKKYASAFFGTDLASRLTSAGVDTVLIAGCTTSGCVRATAVDAVQLGYRPMVVREAVGDRSPAAHDQALFDLRQKYADVVSVRETIDYVSGRVARASPAR
jgi:nicotinamidase-related amidase